MVRGEQADQAGGGQVMGMHTLGRTIDSAARRLVNLRRLARLERQEIGAVSFGTLQRIAEARFAVEAVCVVDDAMRSSRTGSPR